MIISEIEFYNFTDKLIMSDIVSDSMGHDTGGPSDHETPDHDPGPVEVTPTIHIGHKRATNFGRRKKWTLYLEL